MEEYSDGKERKGKKWETVKDIKKKKKNTDGWSLGQNSRHRTINIVEAKN